MALCKGKKETITKRYKMIIVVYSLIICDLCIIADIVRSKKETDVGWIRGNRERLIVANVLVA